MKQHLPKVWSSLRTTIARHRRIFAVLVIAVCLLPATARAAGLGDIVSLLNTISSTIQHEIGGALSGIQAINSKINEFHQEVIWPLARINQARNFVTSTIGRYRNLMWQIQGLQTISATLANPSQLESLFRSADGGSINRLQGKYTSVYATVPGVTNAKPVHRNMMDMDDALAMASLKTTVLSDQSTDSMLRMADSFEQQSAISAPGSAPIITAGAQITNLEAQAYLAKMLAADLRLEAAKLAHENTLLKQSAASTRNLQNQAQQVLAHP
jgi:hypothetical protein